MKNSFIIFLIFVFFIFACTSQSTSKPKEINIFVGTEGLTAEFSKAAPPPRVFEDSSFPILLRLRNNGAYSIKNRLGVISIGREKDYIPALALEQNSRASSSGNDNEVYFDVDGKTQINPNGDNIVISLNAKTSKLEPQSEYKESTLTATLCYPYKTVLSATVCIDPDIAGIRPGKKVCDVKEIVFNNGQGSPIAITKIEPNMIPEGKDIIKPQFLIFIENKGRGNPVDINNYHNVCGKFDFGDGTTTSSTDVKNIWNVARLTAFSSGKEGENQLVCCPNMDGQCPEQETNTDKITGFIRFRDKKDFVRCTFKEGKKRTDDAFTSPLRIEIDYGYIQTIAAEFKIQKPLKY